MTARGKVRHTPVWEQSRLPLLPVWAEQARRGIGVWSLYLLIYLEVVVMSSKDAITGDGMTS